MLTTDKKHAILYLFPLLDSDKDCVCCFIVFLCGGMPICGQYSTDGHPCNTGGVCVQRSSYCTGNHLIILIGLLAFKETRKWDFHLLVFGVHSSQAIINIWKLPTVISWEVGTPCYFFRRSLSIIYEEGQNYCLLASHIVYSIESLFDDTMKSNIHIFKLEYYKIQKLKLWSERT